MRDQLHHDAKAYALIRHFFNNRKVLEVHTSSISKYGNPDPSIEPIRTDHGLLHTSPEFEMKKLLAQGAGDIYQLCRVYRADEIGVWHRPEFLMLEWYRVGWTLHQLILEVLELLKVLLQKDYSITYLTYREAFEHHRADYHLMTLDDWEEWAQSCGYQGKGDQMLYQQVVLTHVIEPNLKGITVLTDFPREAAALAQVKNGIAQRFEVYINGVEIANGFDELTCASEQRQRFFDDVLERKKRRMKPIDIDEEFIGSIEDMPSCVGVALGVDRVLSLSQGRNRL